MDVPTTWNGRSQARSVNSFPLLSLRLVSKRTAAERSTDGSRVSQSPAGSFFPTGRDLPAVPASLPVELNADRMHEVRVVGEFETDGPFAVDLINEGPPAHVHVGLDEDLGRVASVDGGNHYVEEGATVPVPVSVDPVDEPTTGRLTVATGYGAETAEVEVTVRPWEDRSGGVEVDEDLGTPDGNVTAEATGRGGPSLPLLALVGTAVAVAVGVGYYATSPAVLVGVGVVAGAAVATLAFSLR